MTLTKAQSRKLERHLRRSFPGSIDPGVLLQCESISDVVEALAIRLPTVRDGPSLRTTIRLRIRAVLDASDLGEQTALVNVLPASHRRTMWRELRREFPKCLPILLPSRRTSITLGILGALGPIFLTTGAAGGFLQGFVGALAMGLAMVLVGTLFSSELPSNMKRIRDLVDVILQRPAVAKGDETPWTRDQILEVVLAAVRSQVKQHGATGQTKLAVSIEVG